MEVVDVVVGLRIVHNAVHNGLADLDIGHTQISVDGLAVDKLPLAVFQCQHLLLFFGNTADIVEVVGVVVGGEAEGLAGPAVTDVVEHQTPLGDLYLALPLPLEHLVVGNILGDAVLFIKYMAVVTVVVAVGDEPLQHVHIHFQLCVVVGAFQHAGLGFAALVAEAAEPVVSHFVIGNGLEAFHHGDVVAVHTGIQPAAAVFPEHPVDGKQHGPGVGAGQDTALFVGVHMDDVVQHRIGGLVGQTKVLQQTQPEAGLCFGIVGDVDLTALGHHHPQVFFQFLGGMVEGITQPQLVNLQHKKPPSYFSLSYPN